LRKEVQKLEGRDNSYFEKENVYPEIKDIEIGEELENFHEIRKHFLIFTEAGKPVYTRYGEEMCIAPFFATMAAIIPKVQSYFYTSAMNYKEQNNRLRMIYGGPFSCTILRKGNFYYICVCN
jgi:hypothetical protein